MNTFTRPSFALRPQRDSLRHKQFHASRARASGTPPSVLPAGHGSASDSVFKRLPAIGETPVLDTHA
ncbi:hypothetical protein [Xenophilus sp. Marseille-Q4582]|uniref:hypothetical protein n=1 Tax=Xenophilus sp. Marseille-Q4582 TaxID=2866600 RepID=UPI001CE452AC|nr:hypothetical protein [Xenophilus sp. Marseille-Q4582]